MKTMRNNAQNTAQKFQNIEIEDIEFVHIGANLPTIPVQNTQSKPSAKPTEPKKQSKAAVILRAMVDSIPSVEFNQFAECVWLIGEGMVKLFFVLFFWCLMAVSWLLAKSFLAVYAVLPFQDRAEPVHEQASDSSPSVSVSVTTNVEVNINK